MSTTETEADPEAPPEGGNVLVEDPAEIVAGRDDDLVPLGAEPPNGPPPDTLLTEPADVAALVG